jgi:hypothetical protein
VESRKAILAHLIELAKRSGKRDLLAIVWIELGFVVDCWCIEGFRPTSS